MKALTARLIEALERGEPAVLCTVLSASGSSPRGAGARMAVFTDEVCGTVGGGAVELCSIKKARQVLRSGKGELQSFCLAPDQIQSIGMVCGGNVTICFQYLTAGDLPVLRRMQEALHTDADSWLYLELRDGLVERFEILDEDQAKGELFGRKPVLRTGEVLRYAEPLVRAGKVYLFGGGHVGRALAPVLTSVDFRVTVYDSRPELAVQERFPTAEAVICAAYDPIAVELKESDYVVIMTPGHQGDFTVLRQVLRRPLRYVGCIGSRNKIARTRKLLLEDGFSEAVIDTVHSPIGLPILAETPAEIAISVAAEMIRCRAEG